MCCADDTVVGISSPCALVDIFLRDLETQAPSLALHVHKLAVLNVLEQNHLIRLYLSLYRTPGVDKKRKNRWTGIRTVDERIWPAVMIRALAVRVI